jgi:sarcosine oxidase, subunit beta
MANPHPPATHVSVLIVGAGIIGAACAYHAAQRGLRTLVIEAAEAPASGSTGRSAAGVRVQFTSAVNVAISWSSIQTYRDFERLHGVDVGYRPAGYLLLASAAQWPSHLQAAALQQQLGAPVEVLDVAAAQRRTPFDPDGIAGATFGPADGFIDPHSATMAYLGMARAQGAELWLGAPLLAAAPHGAGWRVETPRGAIRCDHLVNAAGAWSGVVAERGGLALPVAPSRRMVFATAPLPGRGTLPLTMDLASGFYLRGEGERVLFGRGNPAEATGFVEGMDWAWLEPTLEVGMARFPWLETAALDRRASWWGYYEMTPDHNPILGAMPGVPGWVNACGFSGHGVMQAPAIGALMAEEIVEGRARTIDIDPLRLDRFQRGDSAPERHVV